MSAQKIASSGSESLQLQRTADGLVWNIEKKEKAIENSRLKSAQQQKLESVPRFQKVQIAPGRTIQVVDKNPSPLADNEYDFMISYSHKDKEICHRIYESLVNLNEFKIWIDKENLYGTATD
ncbi:unnamed protein product, partial [Rotaria sp. Silwood2]